MVDVFLKLADMSLAACWLIAAVLILRPLLRRYSSMLCMAAWALIAIRLLCPLSLPSALSLIPNAAPVTTVVESVSSAAVYEDGFGDLAPNVPDGTPSSLVPQAGNSIDPIQIITSAATAVWLCGIAVMLVYAIVSMARLHRRTRAAVSCGNRVFEGDNVGTPFIVGVFRPRIYIPSDLDETARAWVIAHERSHIRWGDAVFKPLWFIVLILHWYNPLVWVCYMLFCRDMENACDERVVAALEPEERKAYSHALVSCSSPHRTALTPLAFGEVNVKHRVTNVLGFKRPALWIAIAACVLLAIAIPLWFCNPPSTAEQLDPVFDEQLSTWIYEHHEGKYLEGDVNAENHYVLDVKDDDYHTVVYMWVLYQEYDVKDDEFSAVSGAYIPTVVVAHKMGDEYRLEEYWEAEDGVNHVSSIRKHFPMRLWSKATNTEKYIDAQQSACLAVAQFKWQREQNAEQHVLTGTIVAVDDKMLTIALHEGQASSGEARVSREMMVDPLYAVGDEVAIYYDGTVQETYPLQLPIVYAVRNLDAGEYIAKVALAYPLNVNNDKKDRYLYISASSE